MYITVLVRCTEHGTKGWQRVITDLIKLQMSDTYIKNKINDHSTKVGGREIPYLYSKRYIILVYTGEL